MTTSTMGRTLNASEGAARLAAAKAAIAAGTTLVGMATLPMPELMQMAHASEDVPSIEDYPALNALQGGYIALGYREGLNFFYSTQRRCIISLEGNAINSVVLTTHCGFEWLWANFKYTNKEGATAVNYLKARDQLVADCTAAGRYNSAAVMGAGVWAITIDGARHVVCNSAGHVFNQYGHEMPRASRHAVFAEGRDIGVTPGGETLTAADIADLSAAVETFNWANPSDSALLLGWLALGPFSGAMSRRPIFAVQSPPKCGKSTMTELMGGLLSTGCVNVIGAQTTTAGVTDQLQADSVPVLLDEIFAADGASHRDSERVASLMVLLRTAFGSGSSGIAKGTKDGRAGGALYTTRFNAFIASRTFPAMDDQDRSRMVHCRLLPRVAVVRKHRLLARPELLPVLGNRMHNTMFQNWSSFETTYGNVREIFICELDLDDRMAETLGQLIAAWYVLTTGQAADLVTAGQLVAGFNLAPHIERVAGRCDERECADWMLGYSPAKSAHSIGELISRARGNCEYSTEVLKAHGIKLYNGYAQVCSSPSISGLRELFAGSAYADGRWDSLLSNVPGSKSSEPKFIGKTMRATAIPLAWLFEEKAETVNHVQGNLDLPTEGF